MNDITMMPNDYIVTYTKTDMIRERYSNGDVVYVVEEKRVPLILCGECKYWQDNNGGYPHEECRWFKGETPDADDFCSYGERMEE